MALLTCDFFSEALEFGTSITVVLPQPTVGQVGVDPGADADAPPPLLYLLHGRSDDHTAWLRYTSVERYAAAAGVAVVIQPGGAMRDDANVERADELGLAMVFTGERHFLH